MPPDRLTELAATATPWMRSDWIATVALLVVLVHLAWNAVASWRREGHSNAVLSSEALAFVLAAARYSWLAERKFAESWRGMPAGHRPEPMALPPAPEASPRRQLVELCRVRSALLELHRLFNWYAAEPSKGAATDRDRPEWWRNRYERAILGACGEVRSAIADAACWRFPRFSITSRELEAALATAQTSRP